MRLEPQSRREALDVLQVTVEVADAVHPVHGQHLHQANEQVRPAGGVVVQQVYDVAATLRDRGTFRVVEWSIG